MIKIVKGDITTLEVDAIVNAANEMMLGADGFRLAYNVLQNVVADWD